MMMNENETALPADSRRQVTDEMKSRGDVDCHAPQGLAGHRNGERVTHEPVYIDLLCGRSTAGGGRAARLLWSNRGRVMRRMRVSATLVTTMITVVGGRRVC